MTVVVVDDVDGVTTGDTFGVLVVDVVTYAGAAAVVAAAAAIVGYYDTAAVGWEDT